MGSGGNNITGSAPVDVQGGLQQFGQEPTEAPVIPSPQHESAPPAGEESDWFNRAIGGYVWRTINGRATKIKHPSWYNMPGNVEIDGDTGVEVGTPLCDISSHMPCPHRRSCFNMRALAAAWSHLNDGLSLRDAEKLWGASRATIQRRARDNKRGSLTYIVTPIKKKRR